MLPYITSLLAVFGYASLGPIYKKLLVTFPPFAYICYSMLILAAFAGISSLVFERDFKISQMPKESLLMLVIPAFINFVAFSLFLASITKIPVAQYQLFVILTPVFGGLIAIFLLGEAFQIRYVYALILIGLGLYVAIGPDLVSN